MTASSKFFGAASALAMSVALVASGTAALSLASVNVAEAAVVSRIEVRGNTRVDAQSIRDNIDIRPGKAFTSADIDAAVKRLFAMGLFSDVRINQSGSTLVVNVTERSVVNNVLFQGNKKIKDPDLARAVQLKARSPYDAATMEADVEAIKGAYAHIGRSDATVNARTVDLGQGRVNVVYEINEGSRTKIANVDFVGNQAFSSRRLRDVISTKRSNPLSWLTRNDVYDEGRLQADEETLRRFYYNRGYADFRVISSNAVLDPSTNEYTITITVDEGQRYTFGNVSVESNVAGVDGQALDHLVKTRSGKPYSAKEIEDSVLAVTENVAGSGYAFAKVEPRGDRDFENRTISVVYSVDEGPRAYIQRIEIRGNDKTRDFVIRREFDVNEGDAFNQVMVQRAKRRLEALDFFQTVNISTAPGSEPDQVILVVDVVEKSTGEFSIGGGYTTGGESPGAQVEAAITERNFLGRGQYIRISAGAGQDDMRNYGLSFTEPYFLGYRLSAGFDVFRRTYRVNDDYDVEQTGGTIRFGLPITDNFSAGIAYNLVQEKYDLFRADADNYYAPALLEAAEHSPWLRSSISYSLTYNSIDDMKNPHDGLYGKFTQEFAGLGGDAKYIKTTFKGNYYKTLSQEADIVGMLGIGGGYIHEFGDDGVRIFDLFKNNSDIIRGFKFNGIGPYQDAANGKRYWMGGTTYINGTAEVQFPMPLVPESLGIRGAVFADAATLYGNDSSQGGSPIYGDDKKLRASAGVSLMWASPFGPLRFDYAFPIAKADTDKVQNFNFGVSTKF
ncbi:outer membrane protein assembly factor BamA [Brucella intermedia]|uniref:Outer membrane protein assembly factor BamA n=1 Tax=Brucella ciceri TaxID=391287 RepID=A0ABX1DRK9_9HYPH|nr:outer membrane protein assembly factor BamA [Brucella intermedia]NKC27572.1 outer membrane protein assembly factor BamA [Brucella ciceri]PJT27087.1 outer membrane protein assembly factor BamA [Ochrobactrum sp. 30A/1000/2015]PJT38508.1 outer membrane protein assembly factor BamA [Ochrobactrum sp. 27A/999/2015]PJT44526.1 outer membrane protein assembly factor BamA [Ochrobactrum sp. 23A/997/2015]KAB2714553.1 outer membrane protein assembly factor BamA [Brucella intermedia]